MRSVRETIAGRGYGGKFLSKWTAEDGSLASTSASGRDRDRLRETDRRLADSGGQTTH